MPDDPRRPKPAPSPDEPPSRKDPGPPPFRESPPPKRVIKGADGDGPAAALRAGRARTALDSDELIEGFKELTLIELSEFVRKFEQTFDTAAPSPSPSTGDTSPGKTTTTEEEEKGAFDVILESVGDQKIQVIKDIRALTSLGLGEAKALVDGAPTAVLEGVNREDAVRAKAQLEAAGATIRLH